MRARLTALAALATVTCAAAPALAQPIPSATIDAAVDAEFPKAVAWRRDIHQHPELGNRETRTSKLVAAHLRKLGLEVRTGVAGTGVVGVLKGGKPGPVIAIRADMDALPVLENTGEPFASRVTMDYGGKTVPVAHACGHDSHTAMLMGAAEVLAGLRDQIPGAIVFVFQPAEEGAPPGERGGASVMVREGALENPKVEAVFGLHVLPGPVGRIVTRPGPFMAGSDTMTIKLHGKGTHGAEPWGGVDLASLTSAMIQAFNTIASRQVDVTESPTIITIGQIQVGTRFNVIPADATLAGTIRTYGQARHDDVLARVQRTVKDLADSYGATAEVTFAPDPNPAVMNDAKILAEIAPALAEAAGPAGVDMNTRPVTTSEDFSYYQLAVPGVYYHVESTPHFTDFASAPHNHSPQFDIDEAVMRTGMKAHVLVALTYLYDHAPH